MPIYHEFNKGLCNVAAANISFVVSDGPVKQDHSHGRHFITFPINVDNHWKQNSKNEDDIVNIYSASPPFIQEQKFKEGLSLRHQEVNEFDDRWKHSEEVIFHYLSTEIAVIKLLKQIKETLNITTENTPYKIYAIILDIHQTYYICSCCMDAR